MAEVNSLIKLTGTIDGITFYYLNGKLVARKSGGGFTRQRIKNDASMQRTRENSAEFGNCSRANKLFRHGVRQMLGYHRFKYWHSPLMKLFNDLKKLDTQSDRGERQVAIGVQDPEAYRLFADFKYTPQCSIQEILGVQPTYANGEFKLGKVHLHKDLPPDRLIYLEAGLLRLDFAADTSQLLLADPFIIKPDSPSQHRNLAPTDISFELPIVFLHLTTSQHQPYFDERLVGFEVLRV